MVGHAKVVFRGVAAAPVVALLWPGYGTGVLAVSVFCNEWSFGSCAEAISADADHIGQHVLINVFIKVFYESYSNKFVLQDGWCRDM